jgi:hypothetical protein
MYIRDETTLATSNVTLASVANGEEAAAAVTWVFPVAAGARTFSLEAGKFPGAATHEVEFVNPMLTGLFVPFGSAGTGVLSLTSTDAEGTAKLGRLQRDGTRAVMR